MEEKTFIVPEIVQRIEEKVEIVQSDEMLKKILETKFIIYSYITEDNESGTVITRSEMKNVFDTDLLFVMENKQSKEFTIKELLESGQISCGSVDMMETLNMMMPVIGENHPIIRGVHMHTSRQAISKLSGINFKMDPESEIESENDLVDNNLVSFD